MASGLAKLKTKKRLEDEVFQNLLTKRASLEFINSFPLQQREISANALGFIMPSPIPHRIWTWT
jgi:hypothetical protein